MVRTIDTDDGFEPTTQEQYEVYWAFDAPQVDDTCVECGRDQSQTTIRDVCGTTLCPRHFYQYNRNGEL